VEQLVPALTPYPELEDGRKIVAGDCADEIVPEANGQGVRAVWRRWAVVGGKAAQLVDAALETQVTWRIEGDALVRNEKITANRATTLRSFAVMFPSTGDAVSTSFAAGRRTDRFDGREGSVAVTVDESSVPLTARVRATGDSPLGRGARGAIPLVLEYRAEGVSLKAGEEVVRQDVVRIPSATLWTPENPFLYVVETSTNLTDGFAWLPVATNLFPSPPFSWTDPVTAMLLQTSLFATETGHRIVHFCVRQ